jgi:hypothetical protein
MGNNLYRLLPFLRDQPRVLCTEPAIPVEPGNRFLGTFQRLQGKLVVSFLFLILLLGLPILPFEAKASGFVTNFSFMVVGSIMNSVRKSTEARKLRRWSVTSIG